MAAQAGQGEDIGLEAGTTGRVGAAKTSTMGGGEVDMLGVIGLAGQNPSLLHKHRAAFANGISNLDVPAMWLPVRRDQRQPG